MHFYYLSYTLLWFFLDVWSNITIAANLYFLEYSDIASNHIYEFYLRVCTDWILEENDFAKINNQSNNRITLVEYIYYGQRRDRNKIIRFCNHNAFYPLD